MRDIALKYLHYYEGNISVAEPDRRRSSLAILPVSEIVLPQPVKTFDELLISYNTIGCKNVTKEYSKVKNYPDSDIAANKIFNF